MECTEKLAPVMGKYTVFACQLYGLLRGYCGRLMLLLVHLTGNALPLPIFCDLICCLGAND